MIVRKKAVLHVGLCEIHRKKRTTAIIVCVAGVLGGIGLMIGAGVAENGWLAFGGVVFLLVGIIWGVVGARMITPVKIEGDTVWVSGVGREFLDELPER